MTIEKKQSYQSLMQDGYRKSPDYSIGALASMWRNDIQSDRIKAGSPPGTIETEEIFKECLNRIHSAIEKGDLEAIYPEKDIAPEVRLSNGELVAEECKYTSCWIVVTSKYIEWARANGAGPRDLVDDVIEDIEAMETPTESSNLSKQNDILDGRERNNLLKIIASLCEKAGVRPDQDGLDKELEEIIQRLGLTLGSRAIASQLKKAAKLIE
jgi:hypothetical protein